MDMEKEHLKVEDRDSWSGFWESLARLSVATFACHPAAASGGRHYPVDDSVAGGDTGEEHKGVGDGLWGGA